MKKSEETTKKKPSLVLLSLAVPVIKTLMGPAYSAPLMLAALAIVEITVVVYTVKGARSLWRLYWDQSRKYDE